jgi:hypothetical protein
VEHITKYKHPVLHGSIVSSFSSNAVISGFFAFFMNKFQQFVTTQGNELVLAHPG